MIETCLNYIVASSYCCATFGQGYGSILFDNVGCTASDTNLFSCNKNTIGSHNCAHGEDAGALCFGNETCTFNLLYSSPFSGQISGSCTPGDVRLWRPYPTGPSNEGLAIYCKSGTWTPVCDDSWTCHTGRLICQQLGYPGALGD